MDAELVKQEWEGWFMASKKRTQRGFDTAFHGREMPEWNYVAWISREPIRSDTPLFEPSDEVYFEFGMTRDAAILKAQLSMLDKK